MSNPKRYKNQCRICLGEDKVKNLVSPCSCKGTSKYAHSDCLMQWFLHQPTKGLYCSLCLEELSRMFTRPEEDTHTGDSLFTLHLQNPVGVIFFGHWFYFGCFYSFWKYDEVFSKQCYIGIQILFNILHFFYHYQLLKKVKNKYFYLKLWMDKCRFFLPILQVYLFFMLPYTYWLGGVSMNLLMYVFINEHFNILYEINSGNEMRFISRRSLQ